MLCIFVNPSKSFLEQDVVISEIYIRNNMVIQNRMKRSSCNQAHIILKGLILDRNRNETGDYPSITPIIFQDPGKSLLHRKDEFN